MTAASIMRRSASGSAIFPNWDSTCQRRARKPSIWSVAPATAKTTPAGQVCASPAFTMNATKTGISASRAIVNAFGSCVSGAGTARVAIPSKSTVALPDGVKAGGPVRRPQEVGVLGRCPHEAPGAVVADVAAPGLGGLDLGALAPLVEARDGDDVGACPERRRPEEVVGGSVLAQAALRRLAGAVAVVARADARRAHEMHAVRLRAETRELPARVREEVVGVDAVQPCGH